jgi:TRAP-type mannitol/chloroaromatic compound transport system permease large subunit
MSPETTGIVGIAVLLFLFLLRMPVGFAMALVGVSGFAYLSGSESALALLAQDIYETFSSYPLSVIPLFILMGSFAFASGISQRLYRTTHSWVGSYLLRFCGDLRFDGRNCCHHGENRASGNAKIQIR